MPILQSLIADRWLGTRAGASLASAIDGSSISANPGVNPSLTITALAERAMSLIPAN